MSESTTESPETPEAKLRAFIQPIVFVILIAIVLSLFTLQYYARIQEENPGYIPPDISPIPENPEDPGGIAYGAILNTLFYVSLAFIGGLVVLVIIKKGFMRFLVYFFAAMMGFSWFIFGFFYGAVVLFAILDLFWAFIPSLIQGWIEFPFEWSVTIGTTQVFMIEMLLYLFAIVLGLLGTISFGIQSFDKIWLRNLMMIFFGAMIGSMLAIHLGLLTTFFILVGLSLYDIYAVFRGPLKGIIDHSRETAEQFEEDIDNQNEFEYEKVPLLPALPVYSTPLINIGLGDFAFFSMLISAAVVIGYELSTPVPLITAFFGLFVGAYYTFRLLKKERALPGLPLPIFGGLGCLVLGVLACLIFGISTLDSIATLFM